MSRSSFTTLPSTLLKNIIKSLPPDQVLRLLFRLDERLYALQSRLAVAYGGGVHIKHHHMNYHDFFIGKIKADERVLDIGCGIGAVAYDVAEKAQAHVIGLELEARNLDQARQCYAHPRITYCLGDALTNFIKTSVDVVILSNILEHLPERPQFLQWLQKAVHPKRILIRVPLFERDWRVPLKRELGVEWRLDPTHETEYTLESFAAEMNAASLQVVSQEVRWSEIWAETRPKA